MTKNKLLELYQKLLDQNLPINLIKKLKDHSDNEIDIILNSKHTEQTIYTIMSDHFNRLDNDTKKELINLANNASSKLKGEFILCLSRDKNIPSEYVLEVSKSINQTINNNIASSTYNIAINQDVIANEKYLEIIKLLSESQNEMNISWVRYLIRSQAVLASGLMLDIVKIILGAEKEYQAKSVVEVAINENVISSGKVIELATIMSKLNYQQQAYYLLSVATDKTVLEQENAVEIVEQISRIPYVNAYNVNKLTLAMDIARNKNILASGKVLEILKLIPEIKDFQIKCFYDVVKNEGVLETGKVLEFAKPILKAEYEVQLNFTSRIILNKTLLRNARAKYYIEKIMNTKNIKMMDIYYHASLEETVQINKQQCDNKIDEQEPEPEETFWSLFDSDSQKAISLLMQNVNDEEEITSHTRVRRKNNSN